MHCTLLPPHHLGVESISTPLEPVWPYDLLWPMDIRRCDVSRDLESTYTLEFSPFCDWELSATMWVSLS